MPSEGSCFQLIPRQQYEVRIKATLGDSTKAISQALVAAFKKDFSGKLKGNMATDRLAKLLAHQREGKAKMKSVGNINIPTHVFIDVVRDSSL